MVRLDVSIKQLSTSISESAVSMHYELRNLRSILEYGGNWIEIFLVKLKSESVEVVILTLIL